VEEMAEAFVDCRDHSLWVWTLPRTGDHEYRYFLELMIWKWIRLRYVS
jgi:hypothetical protein